MTGHRLIAAAADWTASPTFRAPPLRGRPARRIRDDAEAIDGRREPRARTRGRRRPARSRARSFPFGSSIFCPMRGLLAITVPKAYGGAGVVRGTLAR